MSYGETDICNMEWQLAPKSESGSDGDVALTEQNHTLLLEYLLERVRSDKTNRIARVRRYANIDQMVQGWQKFNPEDSKRVKAEIDKGKSQALPINLPITASHIDDSVAFFAEVFAPLGGNFYANPGKREENPQMDQLVDIMNADTKRRRYYKAVAMTMRRLQKYNCGGFHVDWEEGDSQRAGESAQPGNKVTSLDVFNFFYDTTVSDISVIHLEAEWTARVKQVSRLFILRQADKDNYTRIEKVFDTTNGKVGNSQKGRNAEFYRNPPGATNMEKDGSDTMTGYQEGNNQQVDWASWGLGMESDGIPIPGNELIDMYCWINPLQFGLGGDDKKQRMELWRFNIINHENVVSCEHIEGATEIPTYMCRLNQDDMEEATRSMAELMRGFQRFMSFLLNTHVEGVRSNIWGTTVYDPTLIDAKTIKNGEVNALLASKKGGVDVRTAMMKVNGQVDTSQNLADLGNVNGFLKEMFPNQSLPTQIAGMDRAISSQVAAVLQGAMRKLHMLARLLDADLMLPVRVAMYKNIAILDPAAAKLVGITEEEVANLLNSGLGQVGREAAADSLQKLLVILIQNPDSAQGYDMAGLFTLWSTLLNIGTDLGEFVKAPPAPVTPPGATATAPGPADGSNGQVPPGTPTGTVMAPPTAVQ